MIWSLRDIFLPLWTALVACGWWVIGLGILAPYAILGLVVILTAIGSAALAVYLIVAVYKNWFDKKEW